VKWQRSPRWVKLMAHFFVVLYRARLAARGSLWQKPYEYALYTQASASQRVTRPVLKPTSFWKGRR